MDLDDALEHFRHNHRAVFATRRRDGRPQMSPVVQAVGNDGRILVSTRSLTVKIHNIKLDPYVSVLAVQDGFFGQWVQVDGIATIVEMPDAMALLRFTYIQVSGQHPDWEEFERDMLAQRRVAIAIQPQSAGPDIGG
ncbi:MAG TPA: TIGR03618 family F420-dependent PPOX class oxidoreductase [Acidimicrobiales bacterium]|nr:TIGR03618 family F420-dependent PPOX class oxidoreductase [Acidimicrobiales bacterium]